jgi:hypothetical protein
MGVLRRRKRKEPERGAIDVKRVIVNKKIHQKMGGRAYWHSTEALTIEGQENQ